MVYILLGTGFETVEALAAADVLYRGKADVTLVGVSGPVVTSAQGVPVTAGMTADQVRLCEGDMVVLPGGLGGVAAIEGSEEAMALVRQAAADDTMWLCAICAAPTLLARAGLIGEGVTAVCYPGMEGEMEAVGVTAAMDRSVVVCGKVVTGRAPGSAFDFGLQLLAIVRGEETARSVEADLHYPA